MTLLGKRVLGPSLRHAACGPKFQSQTRRRVFNMRMSTYLIVVCLLETVRHTNPDSAYSQSGVPLIQWAAKTNMEWLTGQWISQFDITMFSRS